MVCRTGGCAVRLCGVSVKRGMGAGNGNERLSGVVQPCVRRTICKLL